MPCRTCRFSSWQLPQLGGDRQLGLVRAKCWRCRGWCGSRSRPPPSALFFSMASLPCTDPVQSSRWSSWHFSPQILGTVRCHSLRSGGAARRHVESVRVVAIVADGIELGRVILVRPGVEGLLVGLDVLGDDAQPRLLGGLVVLLRGFPQVWWHCAQSAFGAPATFLCGRDAVGDFLVAGDALHLGVHALAVFVRIDCLQRALFAVGCRASSSLPFLPSWQVWQVALSSFCATGAASLLAAAADRRSGSRPAQTAAATTQAANLLVPMISIPHGVRVADHSYRLAAHAASRGLLNRPRQVARISATGSTAPGCSALSDPWSRCSCGLPRCRLRA